MIREALDKSMNYQQYRKLIAELRAENKTTGENHSEDMLGYTDLNIARMDKWDKRFELEESIKNQLERHGEKEIWLVLTEAWCGDAAHAVPVLAKMAEASSNIDLRLVLRDENLELMDAYLTNGGRSIPKMIRLDADSLEEISTWGPRPAEAKQLFDNLKAEGKTKDEINKEIQLWYARDRGKAIEKEIAEMLTLEMV